jgi:large subunit ribosomal protein L6
MSRIGVLALPKNVKIDVEAFNTVIIKGRLGTITKKINNTVLISTSGTNISVVSNDDSRYAKMQTGTARSIINNMLIGVSIGFEKKLQLVGVGYRASIQNSNLILYIGFSHSVCCNIPDNISVELLSPTEIILRSFDKELLGQFSSDVRNYRKPEPYKGKGIRYVDEKVVIKEAKKK